jgi:type I restriction enzyme S subunit
MSDLQPITLDEGLERLLDYRGKSPPRSPVGIPVISAKCVKGGRIVQPVEQKIEASFYPIWMTRGLPQVGDVVMTTEGPLGEVAQLDDETVKFALAQRIVCMRGKKGVLDNTFLKYLLMSPAQQAILSGYATGTTVAGISQKSLRSVPISPPLYRDQVAIGRLLRSLDDKIELNRRMNETLEVMARAIFKDWFVDFGPTQAKMEGHAPYLAPETWAFFPDHLDEDDKPTGWNWTPLTDYSLLNPEAWSRDNAPHEIEYLDLASVKWGVIESTQRILWSDAPSRAQRILRAGDTVVGTVRPGNGSYSLVGEDGLTGSTGFAALRPKRAEYREVVYLAATSTENIQRLTHLADGGAYPAVRPDVVGATKVCRPTEFVLSAFSRACAPILDRMEANKQENRTLASTRDLLLPKLMSGEIHIKDAEKIAEVAA